MFESEHVCSFACPICTGTHATMEDLDDHMQIHDQEEEKKASLEFIAKLQAEEDMMLGCCNQEPESDDEDSCIVCLVEYQPGEDLRWLPCKHKFHARCLSDWLSKKKECPVCCQEVVD